MLMDIGKCSCECQNDGRSKMILSNFVRARARMSLARERHTPMMQNKKCVLIACVCMVVMNICVK